MVTIKILMGVVVGGALGFAWYKLVGCTSGACPLTSNPWSSSMYGMLVGGLIAGSLR